MTGQESRSPRLSPSLPLREGLEQDAFDELDAVGLKEILDQDPRPTFVLDLDPDYVEEGYHRNGMQPIFCNAALRLHDVLLDKITGDVVENTEQRVPHMNTFGVFSSWATGTTIFDDSKDVFPSTLSYCSMLWTGSTIRQRWRLISGTLLHELSRSPRTEVTDMLPEVTTSTQAGISSTDEASAVPLNDLGPLVDPKVQRAASLPIVTPNVQQEETGHNTQSCDSPLTDVPKDTSKASSGTKSGTTVTSNASLVFASPVDAVPDWTVVNPKGVLSDHITFARSIDWAATPLGPMESWTPQFQALANLVMKNPHPAALWWGEDLTMLYNEPYMNEVAGNKHPDLMGSGFSGGFSELWDSVAPIFRECALTGKSHRRENDPLPIHRFGYLEETFFSWSFTPIYGAQGRILGFYNAPFETTYQTIRSRRMQTLRLLGEKVSQARSIKNYWRCVLDALEDNQHDVPFAILYSVVDSDDSDSVSHCSDSTISQKSCTLEGTIGLPEGHPAAPRKVDLKRSKEGFIPAFREAMRTREPLMLSTRNGTLPRDLLEQVQWRGSGDACREAIVIPVRPTNGETVFAFLLIGINPRRAWDEDYKAFSVMLDRQLSTPLASFLLFEDEVKRSRNAAEIASLQRERMSQQLELQTNRMRRMTENSSLGMYLFDLDGILLEANERYYEMTGFPRDNEDSFEFINMLVPESQIVAQDMWHLMMTERKPQVRELRLSNSERAPRDVHGEPMEYWVLTSSQPEVINGELRSITGSIADISHMKWAQGLQDRRLREVEETKRQQNEFIDITSHEMRNPLSAILICADDIRDTLTNHQFHPADATIVEECIEAANNIALCVQHQKSIVDDILTVSKLDSNLLLITPVPVQPVVVMKRAMSMFKPEVQAKDIQFNFVRHESLHQLSVDWVNLDPSRLLQITVNLVTNAIKFTQAAENRSISIQLSASREQPALASKDFKFVPARDNTIDITQGDDWGTGEMLYIRVEVQDTGCGLTAEEKDLLFERFAQASPRTHVHYGGSGLGLFISRQLAELHGGQIGVSSEAGAGSMFSFFIQSRRSMHKPDKRPVMSRTDSLQSTKATLSNQKAAVPAATSALTHPDPEPKSPKLQPKTPLTSSASYSHLKILIVEDNIVNQRVLSKQLRKHGCTVHTADNGVHALSFLATTHFQISRGVPLDLIFMDLEMPEMDGLTCVAKIREMQGQGLISGHVPVVAVTANVRDEQIATAKTSGMDDVVSKPFRIPDLLKKCTMVLDTLKGDVH